MTANILFCLLFLHSRMAAGQWVEHGCYIKEKRMTSTSYGSNLEFLSRSNTSSCAQACANNAECDAFSVDKRDVCRLKKSGRLRRVNKGTAGFCPKSSSSFPRIPGAPGFSPLKCSESDGHICQFPFILKGVVHWDCVQGREEKGWTRSEKVCNVKESSTIQEFGNERFFHECTECPSSALSDNYLGFNLTNPGGSSRYGTLDSREDCQSLCNLANGCNFFTFEEDLGDCYLKYGVGEKKSKSNTYFGHKKPQGGIGARIAPLTENEGIGARIAPPTENEDDTTSSSEAGSKVVGPAIGAAAMLLFVVFAFVVFKWVKRCRARRSQREYVTEPKIDQNPDYGVYYRSDGRKYEESTLSDTNPYYDYDTLDS